MIHQFQLDSYTTCVSLNRSILKNKFFSCIQAISEPRLVAAAIKVINPFFVCTSSDFLFECLLQKRTNLCSNARLHQDLVRTDRKVSPFLFPFVQFLMVKIPDHMNELKESRSASSLA